MSKGDRPSLECPKCGRDIFPATGCGRYDVDGNFISHRDGCRCRHCQWMWFDDADPVKCECGTLVGVDVSDGVAFAEEVEAKRKPSDDEPAKEDAAAKPVIDLMAALKDALAKRKGAGT